MAPFHQVQFVIASVAIACAVLCFALYLALSLGLTGSPRTQAEKSTRKVMENAQARMSAVSPAEVTDLIKALASLSESLAKAGPALWSLIGACLFLLIAAVSTGVLRPPPADPAPKSDAAAASTATPTSPAKAGA